MHRISIKSKTENREFKIGDGLFYPPAPFNQQFAAIVLMGHHARLFTKRKTTDLRAGEEISFKTRGSLQALHLQWQTDTQSSRPLIPHESTFNEESPLKGSPFQLYRTGYSPIPIEDSPLIIGRHNHCDINLKDPRVSTFHCAIIKTSTGIRILDLGSRNGTSLENEIIKDAQIIKSTSVRIGRSSFSLSTPIPKTNSVILPSEEMKEIYDIVDKIADSSVPVLILGETGVGKDFLARHIHEKSGRMGPFYPINSASIHPTLATSELFGHIKGAFTGANLDQPGAFQASHQGTLFMDELADLPITAQAEILRAVENQRIRPVGSVHEVPVNVRIIGATNRDLELAVQNGSFRSDLFFRLNVVKIKIPPLRQRREDIKVLVDSFIQQYAPSITIEARAWKLLYSYGWPGNIRELHNTLHRTLLSMSGTIIKTNDLKLSPPIAQLKKIDPLIHDAIIAAYDAYGNSVATTANKLGVQRTTVRRHVRMRSKKALRAWS